jgi:hypothetical protein
VSNYATFLVPGLDGDVSIEVCFDDYFSEDEVRESLGVTENWEPIVSEVDGAAAEAATDGEKFDFDRYFDLEKLDDDVLEAYQACVGSPSSAAEVEDAYIGHYDSDRDFAWELLESLGAFEAWEALPYYIDYDKLVRDLEIDYSHHNGHWFRP